MGWTGWSLIYSSVFESVHGSGMAPVATSEGKYRDD